MSIISAYFKMKGEQKRTKMLKQGNMQATNILAGGIDKARADGQLAKAEIGAITSPIIGAGPNNAQSQLAGLLGLGGGGAEGALAQLQSTPGFNFAVNQANVGLERSAAARGQLLSGNTLGELSQLNQGLANQQFDTRVGQLSGLVQNLGGIQAQNIANTSSTNRDLALQRAQIESDGLLKHFQIKTGKANGKF